MSRVKSIPFVCKDYVRTVSFICILLSSFMLLSCTDSESDDSIQADGDASENDTSDAEVTENTEVSDTEEANEMEEDTEKEYTLPACKGSEIPRRKLKVVDDDTFDMGPYLMNVTPTSITIMWRTLEDGESTVYFGEGDSTEKEITSKSVAKVHKITLNDLKPDTRYSYKAKTNDKESKTHQFYTSVKPGQSFRFAVSGDSRTYPAQCKKVVDALLKSDPHIALNVGDIVSSGDPEEWKPEFFDPYRVLNHQVVTYVAIGNHEHNSSNFYELTSYPYFEGYDLPGVNYTFTYGNAFFLVYDTNQPFFKILNLDHTPISQWMEEQMSSPEAQAATWRIALAHEPAVSASWGTSCNYDGLQGVKDWTIPLMEKHGFQLHLAGHTHSYERAFSNSVVQIISGGGGAELDVWCKAFDEVNVVSLNYHYLNIEAGCEKMKIEAIDLEGNVFDFVELDKNKPGVMVDSGPDTIIETNPEDKTRQQTMIRIYE